MSCCSVCILVWYVATKDARWVRCSCSLGPSPRRPTASCSLAAVRRGDCVRASWLYLVQPFDRYSYFCVYLVLLPYQAGSAQLDYAWFKTNAIFRFDIPMGRVFGFWAKIWRLGPSDSQIRFYPVVFCKIGLHKQAHPFFRSKNKNQKLGIGSHTNQSQTHSEKSRLNFLTLRGKN